jgi:hypothetical protein
VEASTPADQALTNGPPQPVAGGGAFSYSGGNVKSSIPHANAQTAGKKKVKISKPILIALGVVFIIVWGVFWAIIFGIIQR